MYIVENSLTQSLELRCSGYDDRKRNLRRGCYFFNLLYLVADIRSGLITELCHLITPQIIFEGISLLFYLEW